jgi:hypothetical protein
LEKGQTLQFRVPGSTRPLKGVIKRTSATLGSIATRCAHKAGLAGVFEMVDEQGVTLDPNITLGELPASTEEISLSSSLTPA